jgi:hypothetical protein
MTPEMQVAEALDELVADLARRARQGGYAVWATIADDRNGRRWGAARLAGNLTPAILANIATNTGTPVEIRVRVRTGVHCVYVRALTGGGLVYATDALHRMVRAYGANLYTRDATEPAARVLGLSR